MLKNYSDYVLECFSGKNGYFTKSGWFLAISKNEKLFINIRKLY